MALFDKKKKEVTSSTVATKILRHTLSNHFLPETPFEEDKLRIQKIIEATVSQPPKIEWDAFPQFTFNTSDEVSSYHLLRYYENLEKSLQANSLGKERTGAIDEFAFKGEDIKGNKYIIIVLNGIFGQAGSIQIQVDGPSPKQQLGHSESETPSDDPIELMNLSEEQSAPPELLVLDQLAKVVAQLSLEKAAPQIAKLRAELVEEQLKNQAEEAAAIKRTEAELKEFDNFLGL